MSSADCHLVFIRLFGSVKHPQHRPVSEHVTNFELEETSATLELLVSKRTWV